MKKNRKDKKKIRSSVENIAKTVRYEGKKNKDNIYSDVAGSYTGMAYDDERPVQDADDL